jgi:hypothetical protein
MAQDFRNVLNRNVSTGTSTLLTAGDYDAVIGIRVCNILTNAITVDIYIVKGGVNYYLAKTLSIGPGASVELIQGGAKLVVVSGDVVTAVASEANAADIALSYIDTISS